MHTTVSQPLQRPFEDGIDPFQLFKATFPESTEVWCGSGICFRGLCKAQTLYEIKTPGNSQVIAEQVFT